jgi:hypothetical protein
MKVHQLAECDLAWFETVYFWPMTQPEGQGNDGDFAIMLHIEFADY